VNELSNGPHVSSNFFNGIHVKLSCNKGRGLSDLVANRFLVKRV
jgi:hypothetical protein